MKYLFLFCVAPIILTGCNEEAEYLDHKVLWDKNGCAFFAHHHVGDTMFLTFSREFSDDNSCLYVDGIGEVK